MATIHWLYRSRDSNTTVNKSGAADIDSNLVRDIAAIASTFLAKVAIDAPSNSGFTLGIFDLAPYSVGTLCRFFAQLMPSIALKRNAAIRYFFPCRRTLTRKTSHWVEVRPSLGKGRSVGPQAFIFKAITAPSIAGPVLVIASNIGASRPERLLAVHYGRLLEYTWRETAPVRREWTINCLSAELTTLPSSIATVLSDYVKYLNSAPIPYPESLLSRLQSIIEQHHGPLSIYISGKGYPDLKSIRLAPFAELLDLLQRDRPLPINFHFLSHCLQRCGVATEIEASSSGYHSLLAIAQTNQPPHAVLTDCLAGWRIQARTTVDALRKAMRGLRAATSMTTRLALLRAANNSPQVFSSAAPLITHGLKLASENERADWSDCVANIWAQWKTHPDQYRAMSYLAQAAMLCRQWGVAAEIWSTLLVHAPDYRPACWRQLGQSYLHGGQYRAAYGAFKKAILAGDEDAKPLLNALVARRNRWPQRWIQNQSLPISLEPLDPIHAQAFAYQFRDAQIAVMTGLPAMSQPQAIASWIVNTQSDPARIDWAVMHPQYGFIGHINLTVSENVAFFCFWIGVDFQGQDWGRAAGSLAIDFARRAGIRSLITSAYLDNYRSMVALKKLGFQEISLKALPPDQERRFFTLAMLPGDAIGNDEIIKYYQRESIPIQFCKENSINEN